MFLNERMRRPPAPLTNRALRNHGASCMMCALHVTAQIRVSPAMPAPSELSGREPRGTMQ